MIIVAGHLSIDPAQRETAVDAIATCVAATRDEPGNLDYRYSADLADENRFNVVERWENDDAMNTHMAAPHMAAFLTAIGPCISGSVEIIRYDVSGSSKLF